jgi:SAM-dependent methyltransferase
MIMQTRISLVKRIPKGKLFSSSLVDGKRAIFEHAQAKASFIRASARRNRGFTWEGRYPALNNFLAKNKNKIKVFADVGAANIAGAPTTVEAKEILGKDAKVYAVDRILAKSPEARKNLASAEVTQLRHRIIEARLPFQCDAIRLANVSQYMHEEEFVKALDNIWQSLKPHGFLLSAGSFGIDLNNPGNERVLIKVKKTKLHPFGFVQLKIQIPFMSKAFQN